MTPTPCIWTLFLPGYMPTTVNQFLGCHWGTRSKLKARDTEIIGRAVQLYGVPPATCRRRVSMLVVLPKARRATDPDSLWKGVLDSLVACGALRNDSPAWCMLDPVQWARGEALSTFITLEDVR